MLIVLIADYKVFHYMYWLIWLNFYKLVLESNVNRILVFDAHNQFDIICSDISDLCFLQQIPALEYNGYNVHKPNNQM